MVDKKRRGRPSQLSAVRVMVAASVLAAIALILPPLPTANAAATLPPGFQESIVFSDLDQPTVVGISQDGRVFVAEKSGLIKVFDDLSDTTLTTFGDLRTQVLHNFWDRGLLGLAPNFPNDPHLYVFYTHDAAIGGTVGVSSDPCPNPPGTPAGGLGQGSGASRSRQLQATPWNTNQCGPAPRWES